MSRLSPWLGKDKQNCLVVVVAVLLFEKVERAARRRSWRFFWEGLAANFFGEGNGARITQACSSVASRCFSDENGGIQILDRLNIECGSQKVEPLSGIVVAVKNGSD